MKETKALIRFEMLSYGYQLLCVDNVFRIEQADAWTTKIYYGVPGDSSAKCPTATINWNYATTLVGDMTAILWNAIISANNSGACETVLNPNPNGGDIYSTAITISMETLPTA